MRYGYDKCDGDGCGVTSNGVPFPHQPGCRYGTGDPQRDRYIQHHGVAPPGPDVILPPVFDNQPGYSSAARFLCPRGCDWAHVEDPGLEPAPPIRLPIPAESAHMGTLSEALASISPEQASQAITDAANARADETRARILASFAVHYAGSHPGLPAPVLDAS